MDPEANIKEQRELSRRIAALSDSLPESDSDTDQVTRDETYEEMANAAVRLAELVEALDQWRLGGGFDPYRRERVHVAVWSDGDGLNAQAYTTREGAERDYPQSLVSASPVVPDNVTIIESTVQS